MMDELMKGGGLDGLGDLPKDDAPPPPPRDEKTATPEAAQPEGAEGDTSIEDAEMDLDADDDVSASAGHDEM